MKHNFFFYITEYNYCISEDSVAQSGFPNRVRQQDAARSGASHAIPEVEANRLLTYNSYLSFPLTHG